MALHGPVPATDREYLVEIYGAIQDLRDKFTGLPCQLEDSRVTSLEQWRWKITGGLAVLTFFVGAIGLNQLFRLLP